MNLSIDDRSTSSVYALNGEPEGFRTASRRAETDLHETADKHAPKLEVILRYAFSAARRVLVSGGRQSIDRALDVLREELEATLPQELKKIFIEGGKTAAQMLQAQLRTAGGSGSGNFGHAGRPGEVGGSAEHQTTVYGPGKSITLPGRYDKTKLPKNSFAVVSKNGYILVTKSPNAPDYMWVNHVRVADEAQGKGEGSALYFAALEEAKARGFVGILKGQTISRGVSSAAQRVWESFERKGLTEKLTVLSPDGPYETIALVRKEQLTGFRAAKKGGDRPKIYFDFDVKNKAAVDWADRHAAELITNITETSRERISNATAELLETGDWNEALDEILEAVGDPERARLIARNEPMIAVHEGQREAWDQAVEAGLLTGDEEREWIVVGDEKVCPICEGLEGKRAKLGHAYISDDGEAYEGPPAHVSCRCSEGIV